MPKPTGKAKSSGSAAANRGEPSAKQAKHGGGRDRKDSPSPDAAAGAGSSPASSHEGGATAPSWEEMFYRLVLYKSKNGGCCDVPESHVTEDGRYQLGEWVKRQRQLYGHRHRTPSSSSSRSIARTAAKELTDDRIAALSEVGMAWSQREEQWEKMYSRLLAYKKVHGNCDVPYKEPALGRWVFQQRANYANKTGTRVMLDPSKGTKRDNDKNRMSHSLSSMMSDERLAKLEAVGFVWRKKSRTSFCDRLEQLKAFKQENGHCNVPQHYKANRPLGKWVTKLRYQHTLLMRGERHQLPPERIATLEKMGFEWKAYDGDSRKKRDKESLTWVPPPSQG